MTTDIVHWQSLNCAQQQRLLLRPPQSRDRRIAADVARIIERVRKDGDRALLEMTRQYDGVQLDALRVSGQEFDDAEAQLDAGAIAAIEAAIKNVRRFHEAQVPRDIDLETRPGVRCERLSRPIDAVGLYVPAGSAPLPSAAIMLTVPASIAGCGRRVLCTPPRPDGTADAAVLAAARRGGIDEVYKVGGAQAIAALAYGTPQVTRVNKIFGPGNPWVTAAKAQVSADPEGAAIDMLAGPSEVLVIADAAADATFVASDLLSQAEHGPDSQVLLVTTSEALAIHVVNALDEQLATLGRRDIAAAALQHCRFIVTENIDIAFGISNDYAPEHLILHIDKPRAALPSIRNAGSVFLGPWAPESVGDYCSGTNHVLPTCGAARSHGGLGVEQFMRQMTVQELTEDGLRGLASTAIELATLERLDAHATAIRVRLDGAGR